MEVSAFGEHNSVDILSNGSFSADVPQDEPLDIAYIQQAGPDSFINLNGNPDTYYVKQIDGLSEDRDLGTIEIPEGHLLDLKFENETGESLDGITASVRSLDTDTDRWYEIFTTTNSNGFYQATDSSTGIEVNGRIQVAVLGDEDDPRVPDVSYSVNEFTVTESRAETITVNPITASGKFTLPSGSPAVGDDVSVFINADDSAGAITDGEGSFEIQLPQSDDFIPGAYQIQYYRPRLRDESGDGVEGNWVDMYAGPQLDGTSDEDVGTIELPEGDRVQVRTIDEDGNIVENAAVRYRHLNETEDSGASIGFETDETGIASLNGQTGLRLSGPVDITASPPDIDRLADTTVERTITVDEPITVDIEFPATDGSSIFKYADDEGVIRTDGLLRAIEDWRNGGTDTDTLLSVIEAWRSGESVE
jgi:hypothetical protein